MYLNPAGSELLSTDIDQLRANIRASRGMGHVMTGDISEFQSLRFVGFHGLERCVSGLMPDSIVFFVVLLFALRKFNS